jgi:hypothetical protein
MEVKNIYRGKELLHYDYLMSLRDDLREDFFNAHPEYSNLDDWAGDHYTKDGWKISIIQYDNVNDKEDKAGMRAEMAAAQLRAAKEKYPTVHDNILMKWGKDCIVCGYAALMPGAVIARHTGDENRHAKNIRIHIPLVVPDGDIGMEIYGEEVDWSDLFCFDNQKVHSVWNFTDKPRLILLLDLKRSVCGLPQGIPWTKESEDTAPGFAKLYGEQIGVCKYNLPTDVK